jgi:hypothetical protein
METIIIIRPDVDTYPLTYLEYADLVINKTFAMVGKLSEKAITASVNSSFSGISSPHLKSINNACYFNYRKPHQYRICCRRNTCPDWSYCICHYEKPSRLPLIAATG